MQDSSATTTTEDSITKKYLFGSKENETVYKKTKQTIVDKKILRLYQKNVLENGTTDIIICNYLKLSKRSDSFDVMFCIKNIIDDSWTEKSPDDFDINVDLMPLTRSNGELIWKILLPYVVRQIFITHGGKADFSEGNNKFILDEIIKHYMGSTKKAKRENRRTKTPYVPAKFAEGFISHEQWTTASRALVKNLWVHLVDKKLLGKIVTMKGFNASISLAEYIRYSRYADHLIKHAEERPNLVPLLKAFDPSEWKRTDIFSKNNWVRGCRKTTVVDRAKQVKLRNWHSQSVRIHSFTQNSHYKWLFSKSNSVVLFVVAFDLFTESNFLADIKIQNDLPAFFYINLLKVAKDVTSINTSYENKENYVKCYLRYMSDFWHKKGFREAKAHFKARYARDNTLDWLRLDGFANGFPRKNSTWESLNERSEQWHVLQSRKHIRDKKWASALEEIRDDKYVVTPLTSSLELFDEGNLQHHCVGGFDYWCTTGEARIFSIKSLEDEKRYTLCIQKRKGKWEVQQVRGAYNETPPNKIEVLSRRIAQEYKKAEKNLIADSNKPQAIAA